MTMKTLSSLLVVAGLGLGSSFLPLDTTQEPTAKTMPKPQKITTFLWYDVWLPNLAPSAELVQEAQGAATPRAWQSFARKYRAEMARPESRRLLELLAALSHQTNLAVGCYCEDESRCHRSVLRELLAECGAELR